LVPALLQLFIHSRETLRGVEQSIKNDILAQSKESVGTFEVWRKRRFDTARRIASLAAERPIPSPDLQRDVALLASSYPIWPLYSCARPSRNLLLPMTQTAP
jgi:hypothetical protein